MTTAAGSQRTRALTQSSSTSAKSRNYPADTAKQRFMEEVYNKETAIRLGWHFSPTGRQLSKDSMTSRRKEVCRKRIEDACPKPTPALLRMRDRFDAPRDFRRRAFDIDGFPVETVDLKQTSGDEKELNVKPETQPEPEGEMYPVEPAVRSLLYDGFSHEGRGRGNYLRHRKKADPEQRYRDPVTTSLEYGWSVAEMVPQPAKPRHGRASLVNSTFYARNGISTLVVPANN